MMSISRKAVVYCLAVGTVLVLCFAFFIRHYSYQLAPPDGNIKVRYLLSVENTTNRPIASAGISLFGPVSNTANQACQNIQTSCPHLVSKDALGNQRLYFQWEILPPFTTKIITIQSDVQVWEKPHRVRTGDLKDFLQSEPLIESDSNEIQKQAADLKAETSLLTAEKINNWVAGHIDYKGYVGRVRGAAYALEHRQGDCTEYAFLFVALCRANGIPARPMAGFVCPQSMVVDFGDYHNWAEFYLDGRWHIADPQNKKFMSNKPYYVAFQIIRPSEGLNGFLIDKTSAQGLRVKIQPRTFRARAKIISPFFHSGFRPYLSDLRAPSNLSFWPQKSSLFFRFCALRSDKSDPNPGA